MGFDGRMQMLHVSTAMVVGIKANIHDKWGGEEAESGMVHWEN